MKVLSLLFLCLCAPLLFAQPTPRLTIVTPAGGQAGTTVLVKLTGVDLDVSTNLIIAPAGLTVTRVPNLIKTGDFLPNQFIIRIPKDLPPTTFDIRAVGPFGVTNPRAFVVGELPEKLEVEPNNDVEVAQPLALNTTVNGVIAASNDVDYFAVTCTKGQTVLVDCAAESIDSRLEPDIKVYHKSGKLLAANRPRAEPDGFCHFTPPDDGVYYVRLCAHAHVEGNPESFYRLSISTRPRIEAITPNVIEPGKAVAAALWGRNLTGATSDSTFKVEGQPLQKQMVTLAPPSEISASQLYQGYAWLPPGRAGLDGYFYRTRNAVGWSNPVSINFVQAPVVLESANHSTADKAQPVTLPVEILGRIDRRDDRDWYSFTGKAGDVISLEGFAERLNVPLDLYFELRNDKGTLIGEYDDHTDQSVYHRFFARSDDPSARVTLPAEGKYLLMVSSRDATLRGDPRLQYRVSLHKPKPDFRAVVVDAHPQNPGAMRLVPGGRQHLDVVLFRRDGFTGPVTVTVENLPAGITCPPVVVPANVMTAALVFTAADKTAEYTGSLVIKATATIDGQKVVREARSGCLIWPNANEQNNGAGISRLCRSTVLAVRNGKPSLKLSATMEPARLPAGSNQAVKVKLERLWPEAKVPVVVTAVHLPPGVTFNNNQPLTIAPDKNDAEVRLVVQQNSVAEEFPLVLRAVAAIPFAKDPAAKQKPPTQMTETSATINITAYRQVVQVTQPSGLELKAGGEVKVPLKFTRLHGFQGPVTIQPQGLPAGVTAAAVTLPEKATDATLVLKANQNVAAGQPTITLRCIGNVMNINLTTEARLSLKVSKSDPPAKTEAPRKTGAPAKKEAPAKTKAPAKTEVKKGNEK
jgi:hypothetical protein